MNLSSIPTTGFSSAPVVSVAESKAKASFIVFTGQAGPPPVFAALGETVEFRTVPTPARADPGDLPGVLLLSADMDLSAGLTGLPGHVVVLSADPDARRTAEREGRLFLSMADVTTDDGLLQLLRSAAHHSWSLLGQARVREQLGTMTEQLRQLNKIGMALMSERDPDTLLGLILAHARRVTVSDAGSLYLVEQGEDGRERLHFLRAQNDSLPDLPDPDFTLPLDRSSIAGYAASSGEPLLIEDVYEIPEYAPYSFNRGFDRKHGYRAKSMLTVPMKDHKERVVGVLQLINRKRNPTAKIRSDADSDLHVLPYTQTEVEGVWSLAGQAAISIENGQLYREIENLFEGFIKAAVTAIDQRDPTTSGHSVRVATLTCDLAEHADRATSGPFKDVRFTREQMRELRYAGLLHDFGKVGVREEVLVKPKKLPTVMLERIQSRFELIRRSIETEFHKQKAEFLAERGRDGFDAFTRKLEEEFQAEMDRLEGFHQAILESNEPRLLAESAAGILEEIARTTFRSFGGEEAPYITPDELHFLSIPRGSLDPEERLQIESHVTHTYNFLNQIPWTEDLAKVAEIAFGHHEKLSGKGYPRQVGADQIPIQTRIMTVSDIFDALTASDRPYKRAVPTEKALDILGMEAKAGDLDPAVVELVVESKVYERVLQEDWRDL
ncbi:MAG TPA: HD domain-containing phosphohydrolase [Candidatus Limnocylindrales bacterium]|nr:HD domain-containing phosphohydrolase [Candidatus Limnocylindrales bacterium]